MPSKVDKNDLRVLSLLHALCDRDEFVNEAMRLLVDVDIDKAIWREVVVMARDVAPQHPLFDPDKSIDQLRAEFSEQARDDGRRIVFDRRKGERRKVQRRALRDRRAEDRRAARLAWLGEERRAGERRQFMRRKEDQMVSGNA